MPMEAVRPAGRADLARVAELVDELREAVRAQRGGPHLIGPEGSEPPVGPAGAGVRLEDLVAEAGCLVSVGTLDDVVVAFAVCRAVGGPDHGRHGVLEACYVEPGARGVGLGRLLMEAALAWSADQGCEWVDGTALPGDREAKNFFESAGFKARMLTMHRHLGGGAR